MTDVRFVITRTIKGESKEVALKFLEDFNHTVKLAAIFGNIVL